MARKAPAKKPAAAKAAPPAPKVEQAPPAPVVEAPKDMAALKADALNALFALRDGYKSRGVTALSGRILGFIEQIRVMN